jgi:type II secretion system protein N
MRALIRFLKYFIVSVVILCVLGYVAAYLLFPTDKLVARLAQAIEQETGNKLTVERARYYPPSAFVLRGIKLVDPDGRELLSAYRARMRIAVIPLLRNQARVKLDAELWGGDLRIGIDQSLLVDDAPRVLDLMARNIDLSYLPTEEEETLRGTLTLTANLRMGREGLPTLSGDLNFSIQDGSLPARNADLLGMPARIPFDSLIGECRIVSGEVFVDSLIFDSPIVQARAKGNISLVPEIEYSRLNLTVELLSRKAEGGAASAPPAGAPFVITGTLAEPRISLQQPPSAAAPAPAAPATL